MQQRVEIPGATLNVEDVGQGPPILFVHGFPLDHTMWRHQLADLSSDFRCLAPDLRGFGQSTVTEGTVTMEQFADDLAALLDTLKITEPVIFCGLSMGGYIAWQFVHRHADRLKALILCDTRAAPDTPEGAANRLKLANEVVDVGPAIVADTMLPKLLMPGRGLPVEHIAAELRQIILNTSPLGIAAASRGMAQRMDARPILPEISVPTLVLVGEHDLISPPAEMSNIAAAIPHAEFRVIPQAGHMVTLEQPSETNGFIREFTRQLLSIPGKASPKSLTSR